MLILKPYETKLLMPVGQSEWRAPSRSTHRDHFGNLGVETSFIVRARLDDGHVRWLGRFTSRDDFDAFLWAVALGTLDQQPALWRLPTPNYHPDLGEGALLAADVVTWLSTTGSLLSWTVPADFSAVNKIDTIGGGGSGANANDGRGGSGAAWNRKNNLALTPGASVSYRVGSGGLGVGSASSSGNAGSDTWLNGANIGASSVGSKAGLAGTTGTGAVIAGGVGASGVGDSSHDGGNAGSVTTSGNSGGGGAGGPTGAGVASGNVTSNASPSDGGNGDAGSGGAGSAAVVGNVANAGGNGLNMGDNTRGPGGGSGGVSGSSSGTKTNGAGGLYGAGSGSIRLGSATTFSGAGGQGLILVVYTPFAISGNLAMMGF